MTATFRKLRLRAERSGAIRQTKAGKPFLGWVSARRHDTGELATVGKIACSATIGARKLPASGKRNL